MAFSDLLGQDGARRQLLALLSSGRLAPSYLFYGPEGVGQFEYANAFLKGIFCPNRPGDYCDDCSVCRKIDHRTFPDVTWIELRQDKPGGKANVIEAEQVREGLVERAGEQPIVADRKIFVIHPAELMSVPASNVLLKVLEEPPPFCHLLLLCGNVNALLPTLYSRCQKVRFVPVHTELIERDLLDAGTEPETARLAATISAGRPELARKLAERDLAKKAVELLREVYRGVTGDGMAAMGAAGAVGKDRGEAMFELALLRTLLFDALRTLERGEGEGGPLEKALRSVGEAAGAERLLSAIEAAGAAEEALRGYANTTIAVDRVFGELIGEPGRHGR